MRDLTLTEIWVYPIKSLGGIQLNSAKVMEKGLLHDRRWMLIDENGIFMTQRVHPEMALFKVGIKNGQLTITKRDASLQPSLTFDVDASPVGQAFQSRVWDDDVMVAELDYEVSKWFTLHMGFRCRLVCFPEKNFRTVDPRFAVNNENVSLADAYPYTIIGQSSLDELNSRLDEALPINRFRPNFVFRGGEPFEEDQWRNILIGSTRFVGVKNCSRCVLTTVDQQTATKGIEPLATLSTYRKRDNKIYFGQNLVALDHQEVRVGDKITVN
jgi:uncharacterized protein